MNKLLNGSKLFVRKNASTILTCIGAIGVIATSVLAVRATSKALMLLENAKEEKGESLTKMEVVKTAGPAYIPAVLVGMSTIACIFGANALNQQRQAALTSAYVLLDNTYQRYKSKVADLYGEEADLRVREDMAKDKYAGDNNLSNGDVILFYDEFSGRYFNATMADILKAEYEVNKKLSNFGEVCLNEFYELVGLNKVDYGDYLGWSTVYLREMYCERRVDFHREKFILDDGLEGYIIVFSREPMPGFETN